MTIKDLRVNAKLLQKQVAFMVGITPRHYRHWEKGQYMVPTGRLVPLSRALKVSVGELYSALQETRSNALCHRN